MSTSLPEQISILIVDDEPERLELIIEAAESVATVSVRTPSEVSDEDLVGVDLVSVDEFLGPEWALSVAAGTDSGPVSRKNIDGLAVAASFRSQTRQAVRESGLNFAVTLHTAELEKLAGGLPNRSWEPLTAAQHDLDWVFAFKDDLGFRLVEMAMAVKSARFAADSLRDDFGTSWLELPATPWAATAREQIEDCRPPAHALAVNTRGHSYLRWFAQRVLPYPTFLINDPQSAHLLGITQESLLRLIDRVERAGLSPQYAGPLKNFAGSRWWRAGWQQILVDAGANQWDTSLDRAEALNQAWDEDFEPLNNDQPVITYDVNGYLLDIDVDAEVAVRLQADGWPIYADDPWSLVEDVVDDPDLARLVALSDRPRIVDAP